MLYNEYEKIIDGFQNEIQSLKKRKLQKEADLKKLDMIYAKVQYFDDWIKDNAKFDRRRTPASKSYEDSLTHALNELGDWRDYLWETYQFEE